MSLGWLAGSGGLWVLHAYFAAAIIRSHWSLARRVTNPKLWLRASNFVFLSQASLRAVWGLVLISCLALYT